MNARTRWAICATIMIFETLGTLESIPWLEVDTEGFDQADNYSDQAGDKKSWIQFSASQVEEFAQSLWKWAH